MPNMENRNVMTGRGNMPTNGTVRVAVNDKQQISDNTITISISNGINDSSFRSWYTGRTHTIPDLGDSSFVMSRGNQTVT